MLDAIRWKILFKVCARTWKFRCYDIAMLIFNFSIFELAEILELVIFICQMLNVILFLEMQEIRLISI